MSEKRQADKYLQFSEPRQVNTKKGLNQDQGTPRITRIFQTPQDINLSFLKPKAVCDTWEQAKIYKNSLVGLGPNSNLFLKLYLI